MKPSELPALAQYPNLRRFADVHVDMQVNDVRCMLQSPLPESPLDAGYNFAAVSTLCALIAGASVLFYCPSLEGLSQRADRGKRFKRLVEDYFPTSPLDPDEAAEALWAIVRNPLTHVLGVSTSQRVLVEKRALSSDEVAELEVAKARPDWCPPSIHPDQDDLRVDAAGLYWGYYRMLEGVFGASQHAGPADRLAAQIALLRT